MRTPSPALGPGGIHVAKRPPRAASAAGRNGDSGRRPVSPGFGRRRILARWPHPPHWRRRSCPGRGRCWRSMRGNCRSATTCAERSAARWRCARAGVERASGRPTGHTNEPTGDADEPAGRSGAPKVHAGEPVDQDTVAVAAGSVVSATLGPRPSAARRSWPARLPPGAAVRRRCGCVGHDGRRRGGRDRAASRRSARGDSPTAARGRRGRSTACSSSSPVSSARWR